MEVFLTLHLWVLRAPFSLHVHLAMSGICLLPSYLPCYYAKLLFLFFHSNITLSSLLRFLHWESNSDTSVFLTSSLSSATSLEFILLQKCLTSVSTYPLVTPSPSCPLEFTGSPFSHSFVPQHDQSPGVAWNICQSGILEKNSTLIPERLLFSAIFLGI